MAVCEVSAAALAEQVVDDRVLAVHGSEVQRHTAVGTARLQRRAVLGEQRDRPAAKRTPQRFVWWNECQADGSAFCMVE